MATKEGTVTFLLDQFGEAGAVTAKKMFGEYGVFLDGKMIAIIGDDQLYVKPTEEGRRHFPEATEAMPYPGAKPCLLVPEEAWDDREWLSELARITAKALPPPKKKTRKVS
jgi:TfoX/Sxy family transcriptional regulator of competence genes